MTAARVWFVCVCACVSGDVCESRRWAVQLLITLSAITAHAFLQKPKLIISLSWPDRVLSLVTSWLSSKPSLKGYAGSRGGHFYS